jgi:hypothetical protein
MTDSPVLTSDVTEELPMVLQKLESAHEGCLCVPFFGMPGFCSLSIQVRLPRGGVLGPGEKEKEAKLDGLVSIGLERQIVMIRVT